MADVAARPQRFRGPVVQEVRAAQVKTEVPVVVAAAKPVAVEHIRIHGTGTIVTSGNHERTSHRLTRAQQAA